MSTSFVWLVKIVCLAGSALSTWYFLQTMFPPSLFSIVPIGWACFEIGVLLWPKYAFSKEERTFSQRLAGFIMAFVSFTGCAACFVGNVFMLGPDQNLFALTSSMKAFIVYGVVGDILLTILVAMLVTSVLPYWHMLDRGKHQPKPSIFIDRSHEQPRVQEEPSIFIDTSDAETDQLPTPEKKSVVARTRERVTSVTSKMVGKGTAEQ